MDRVLISVLLVPLLTFLAVHGLYAAEPCKVIHGRAHFYGGDGQLRIWQIGTHHEYEPDEPSWPRVIKWLEAGVPESEWANYASPTSSVNLYADFFICPTEPFKQGSVQRANIKSASHRRYVKVEAGSERWGTPSGRHEVFSFNRTRRPLAPQLLLSRLTGQALG